MCLWHGDQGPSPKNYRKSTLLLPTKPGCKWQVYFGTFAKSFAQTRISLLECILHTGLSAIPAGNWPGQCSSHPHSSFLGEKLRQDIRRKALRGHMLMHYPSLHLWRNATCSIMVTAMKTTLCFFVLLFWLGLWFLQPCSWAWVTGLRKQTLVQCSPSIPSPLLCPLCSSRWEMRVIQAQKFVIKWGFNCYFPSVDLSFTYSNESRSHWLIGGGEVSTKKKAIANVFKPD